MPQRSIFSVLATTDEQLRERMALILPGDRKVQPSGQPALVPFMPKQLLCRIFDIVDELGYEHCGNKQAALGCVLVDVLWGAAKRLPRRDDRCSGHGTKGASTSDELRVARSRSPLSRCLFSCALIAFLAATTVLPSTSATPTCQCVHGLKATATISRRISRHAMSSRSRSASGSSRTCQRRRSRSLPGSSGATV